MKSWDSFKLIYSFSWLWKVVVNISHQLINIGSVLEAWLTAQKMKFSIEDFFSKCDQIRSFLRIWSHLQKKSLMEILFFVLWLTLKAVEWYTRLTTIHDEFASLILDTIKLLHPNITFVVSAENPVRSVVDNLCFSILFLNTVSRSSVFFLTLEPDSRVWSEHSPV